MRTRLRAAELDQALAAGADPLASEELTLRAEQLAQPTRREDYARSLELVAESAQAGWLQTAPGPTIRNRKPVVKNQEALLALARRLRGTGPHCLRGLAMTDLLIHCGTSSLYAAPSPDQLRQKVEEILAALDVTGLRVNPDGGSR
jgi:hypothetical protein